jgi:L,D-transpeptidase ErfK/SrfK
MPRSRPRQMMNERSTGRARRWATGLPPAIAAAALLLAGCAGPNRPAWERAAVGMPPATPAAEATAPKPPQPASRTVERSTLPPPGTAAAEPTSAPKAGATKPAPSAAGTGPSDVPLGAAGRMMATASSFPSSSPASPSAVKPAVPPSPPPTVKQAIDPAWTGVETYTARHEDTLLDIAVDRGAGFIELAMANRDVDPWLPGEGTTILLPKQHLLPDAPHQGLVLNLPEQRLYYFEKGRLVRTYPIGIGRDGHSTPLGGTTVVRKAVDPVWRPTPSARADDPELPAMVPAGPDNPLGSRALYLGWTSYLIHGTNKEYGIGRRASRGCIRMYDKDVRELYEKVAVGTAVTAVDQPVKVGWIGEELYIEASPTIDQVRQWEEEKKFDPAPDTDARELVMRKAGNASERVDWAAVDRALEQRRGIVTRITRPVPPKPVATAALNPPAAAAPAATISAAPGVTPASPASGAIKPAVPGAAPVTVGAVAPPPPARVVLPSASSSSSSTAAVLPPASVRSPQPAPSAPSAAPKPASGVKPPAPAGPAATAPAEPTGDELVKWLRGRLSDGSARQ